MGENVSRIGENLSRNGENVSRIGENVSRDEEIIYFLSEISEIHHFIRQTSEDKNTGPDPQ